MYWEDWGQEEDSTLMRLIPNPSTQRLKAVPEDTRATGGVKIP